MRADPKLLAELRQRVDEYMARLKVMGVQTLAYSAPCCGNQLETRAAPVGDKWDTLATCHHCGGLYMKITHHDHVETFIPEGLA